MPFSTCRSGGRGMSSDNVALYLWLCYQSRIVSQVLWQLHQHMRLLTTFVQCYRSIGRCCGKQAGRGPPVRSWSSRSSYSSCLSPWVSSQVRPVNLFWENLQSCTRLQLSSVQGQRQRFASLISNAVHHAYYPFVKSTCMDEGREA